MLYVRCIYFPVLYYILLCSMNIPNCKDMQTTLLQTQRCALCLLTPSVFLISIAFLGCIFLEFHHLFIHHFEVFNWTNCNFLPLLATHPYFRTIFTLLFLPTYTMLELLEYTVFYELAGEVGECVYQIECSTSRF